MDNSAILESINVSKVPGGLPSHTGSWGMPSQIVLFPLYIMRKRPHKLFLLFWLEFQNIMRCVKILHLNIRLLVNTIRLLQLAMLVLLAKMLTFPLQIPRPPLAQSTDDVLGTVVRGPRSHIR